jgi:hypothetical protein
MKTSTIKRIVPIVPLHPWDKRRLQRNLARRSTFLFRAGVGLLLASIVPFLANAPLWVLRPALGAIFAAGGLLAFAAGYAIKAGKYE